LALCKQEPQTIPTKTKDIYRNSKIQRDNKKKQNAQCKGFISHFPYNVVVCPCLERCERWGGERKGGRKGRRERKNGTRYTIIPTSQNSSSKEGSSRFNGEGKGKAKGEKMNIVPPPIQTLFFRIKACLAYSHEICCLRKTISRY
jgi:hypothetical protein